MFSSISSISRHESSIVEVSKHVIGVENASLLILNSQRREMTSWSAAPSCRRDRFVIRSWLL